jgi:hypothetical protein
MSVPGFQDWFYPLLNRVADGQVYRLPELFRELAESHALTDEGYESLGLR